VASLPRTAQGINRRINWVTLLGAVVGLAALLSQPGMSPGWLLFKANRVVAGESFSPYALSSGWTLALAAVWLGSGLLSVASLRWRSWLQGALAAAALLLAVLFIRQATSELLIDAARSARVSLQGGIWLTLLAVYISLFGASSGLERRRAVWLVLPSALVLLMAFATGAFAELGIARELASQGGTFGAELRRHLALSLSSVLLAALIGVPAAIWAARQARVAAVVLPTAGLLQTVPSLALFGILLAPLAQLGRSFTLAQGVQVSLLGLALALGLVALSARLPSPWRGGLRLLSAPLALPPAVMLTVLVAVYLHALLLGLLNFEAQALNVVALWREPLAQFGVRGIGAAPALIALTLYALLPVVRNAYTGISEVPQAVIEAGRGMGMSPGQILRRIELPLALPLIVEGLRGSAVLTIGITTVAALIGAGGLGFFVLRGIDQVVPDLILLGALPIILLALVADGLLKLAGLLLTPRGVRR
jgi:osmoprotectant transport system permease protein